MILLPFPLDPWSNASLLLLPPWSNRRGWCCWNISDAVEAEPVDELATTPLLMLLSGVECWKLARCCCCWCWVLGCSEWLLRCCCCWLATASKCCCICWSSSSEAEDAIEGVPNSEGDTSVPIIRFWCTSRCCCCCCCCWADVGGVVDESGCCCWWSPWEFELGFMMAYLPWITQYSLKSSLCSKSSLLLCCLLFVAKMQKVCCSQKRTRSQKNYFATIQS